MKKNVDLDAALVHAAMNGLFEPCAIRLGLSPNQAFERAAWLKKQPKAYVDQVVLKVEQIEQSSGVAHERGTDGDGE